MSKDSGIQEYISMRVYSFEYKTKIVLEYIRVYKSKTVSVSIKEQNGILV